MNTTVSGLILGPGSASASGLSANANCVGTPPRAVVALRWTASGAGPQRVDVAVADGLTTGRFLSSAELAAGVGSLDWTRAAGEAEHAWRVLTRTAAGWVPSATAAFTGPGCVGADYQG